MGITEEPTASVFRAEDGGNKILQNVDTFLLDYMASHPRTA
jgi:hypothetical protein